MTLVARSPSRQLVDLVGALGGQWHGYTAMCRCPAHADRTPSLSLRQGDRNILVNCFAGCDRADIVRQLRRVRPDRHFAGPAAPASSGAANAERLWDLAGSVANTLADRYLLSRQLIPPPADLRFLARCPFGPRPTTIFEPALLVAVREGRRLRAVQRVFLDPITTRHIRKVMLGSPGSGCWQGGVSSRLLAIAEGFETAAAFAVLHPMPCWASLGAGRLDLLRLPDTLDELVLAHDRDVEGARAADRAERRYARPGLRIRRAPPPAPFKDWAELLEAHPRQGKRAGG